MLDRDKSKCYNVSHDRKQGKHGTSLQECCSDRGQQHPLGVDYPTDTFVCLTSGHGHCDRSSHVTNAVNGLSSVTSPLLTDTSVTIVTRDKEQLPLEIDSPVANCFATNGTATASRQHDEATSFDTLKTSPPQRQRQATMESGVGAPRSGGPTPYLVYLQTSHVTAKPPGGQPETLRNGSGKRRGRVRMGASESDPPTWTAAQQRAAQVRVEAATRRGDPDINVSVVMLHTGKILGLLDLVPPTSATEAAFVLVRQEVVEFHSRMEWLQSNAHFEAGNAEGEPDQGHTRTDRTAVSGTKFPSSSRCFESPRSIKRSAERQACPPVLDASTGRTLLIDVGTGKPVHGIAKQGDAANVIHHSRPLRCEDATPGGSRVSKINLVPAFGSPILCDIYCTTLLLSLCLNRPSGRVNNL